MPSVSPILSHNTSYLNFGMRYSLLLKMDAVAVSDVRHSHIYVNEQDVARPPSCGYDQFMDEYFAVHKGTRNGCLV